MIFLSGSAPRNEIFEHPVDRSSIKIYFLEAYYPYDGGANPKFNSFSRKILDFKEGQEEAINFFYRRLDSILSTGFSIAIIPGHSPDSRSLGFRGLVKALATSNRVDARSCLIRHTKIDKLAQGGDRSYSKHLATMSLRNAGAVSSKTLLLLDDVGTTGNSMMAGRELLLTGNASKVVCLMLGRTVRG